MKSNIDEIEEQNSENKIISEVIEEKKFLKKECLKERNYFG